MEAKSAISLVSGVQKPAAQTPILQRRSKFAASIESQILKIGYFRDGNRVSRECFWSDASGAIFFQLRYGKQPLEMRKNQSVLKAKDFDDLVAQLDEIKIITVAGGLDDALAAAAKAVQQNFKAAREKKSARS